MSRFGATWALNEERLCDTSQRVVMQTESVDEYILVERKNVCTVGAIGIELCRA